MLHMREQIEAMKKIWDQIDPSSMTASIWVKVVPMMTWPKPVQKPHPPVIVGGAFPWAARRAVRYGDGWYPNASSGKPEEIPSGVQEDGCRRRPAASAGDHGRLPSLDADFI